jgi:uncharacterized protein with von Willebrand factor type A (vWA) domain
MEPLASNLMAFLRGLRQLGLAVGPSEEALALRALAAVGVASGDDAAAALAAVLVKREEDAPLFRLAWETFLLQLTGRRAELPEGETFLESILRRRSQASMATVAADAGPGSAAGATLVGSVASWEERLRRTRFAELTPAEAQMLEGLALRLPKLWRRGQRSHVGRTGELLDVEGTVRAALESGEWLPLSHRRARPRQRQVVLLIDVSGSMEAWSRGYLHFAHALLLAGAAVEVFTFGTRLTRVTSALRHRSAEEALREVSDIVPDISGGTRLAPVLRQLLAESLRPVLLNRPVLVLATDGLDSGEPEDLAAQLAALRLRCKRILWWNPDLGRASAYWIAARGTKVLTERCDEAVPAYDWATVERAWLRLTEGH